MHKVYYNEEMPYKFKASIFLAGPSLREGQDGESWRKDALQILSDIGFDGVVFIPENRDGKLEEKYDHDKEISWEQKYLELSDCILFWIPRSDKLPGYTTNVEYGRYYDTGRVVLGFPEDALKMGYLKYCAEQENIEISYTLTQTIENALKYLGDGAERSLGERYIPIDIWKTPTFQQYYRAQLDAGNRLEMAEPILVLRSKKKPPLWVVRPHIYIAKENRIKQDEIVIGRPDISSVCMWKQGDNDIDIVLVKEFRAAASNSEALVYELPGGGIENGTDIEETAIKELNEEVGIFIDEKRLKKIQTRQLCATMLSHKSHLFSYQLNDEELEWLHSQKDIAKGIKKEGERTFVEVVKLSEIMNKNMVDWGHLGQILKAVYSK